MSIQTTKSLCRLFENIKNAPHEYQIKRATFTGDVFIRFDFRLSIDLPLVITARNSCCSFLRLLLLLHKIVILKSVICTFALIILCHLVQMKARIKTTRRRIGPMAATEAGTVEDNVSPVFGLNSISRPVLPSSQFFEPKT